MTTTWSQQLPSTWHPLEFGEGRRAVTFVGRGHDGSTHVSVSVNNGERIAGVFLTLEQTVSLAQQLLGEVAGARAALARLEAQA